MAKRLNTLDMGGNKIVNAGTATSPGDVVTKAQLDAVALGRQWFDPVRLATTANVGLSGLAAIDGVTPSAGDRILVKDQTTPSQNGIYLAAASGWARAADADESSEVRSTRQVSVQEGTANGDTNWQLSTDGTITVGTTAQTWIKMGGTGVSYGAGDGISISGSTISVKRKASAGVLVDGDGLYVDPSFTGLAKRYAQNVPASASAAITHNLGTLDVAVSVYEISSGALVEPDVTLTSVNVVTLTFATAPATGQYRVVIVG